MCALIVRGKKGRVNMDHGDVLYITYETFRENNDSIKKTAEELGVARSTISRRLYRWKDKTGQDWKVPTVEGGLSGLKGEVRKLPSKGKIHRYIVSCAQNNTYVHKPFMDNLEAYAKYIRAEILISQFSYNKASYGKKSIKPGTVLSKEDMAELWFDKRVLPYICNERVALAPTLVFCGENNILPTAVRPLSGFENYAGAGVSGIFPHTSVAMESIAALSDEDVKFNYSTGGVTLKNYIRKKAGLKAEFHHCFAALIVEVNYLGEWWVRQLNAEDDGTFYDLIVKVSKGEVTTGHRVEAINWGDVHLEVVDKGIKEMNWGKGGMIDILKPKFQFMHDVVDFYARNHHRIKNHFSMYQRWITGTDSVEEEMCRVKDFLNEESNREGCTTIVVDSNHDNALERWLLEADYKSDHANAMFFLETQLLKYKAITMNDENFHLIESVLTNMGVDPRVQFLREGTSFLICGEIECGMHGHLGSNGARGSTVSLSKAGRKTNTGHTHSAQILHGAYVAGTSSRKRVEYNKGLSSWSHSHIITYGSGKRAIVTAKNGRYCA